MDQFLSGNNVQQAVANSKQTPALIQTSVSSSAASKEAESIPAASKVLLKATVANKKGSKFGNKSFNLLQMMMPLQLQNNELAAEINLK